MPSLSPSPAKRPSLTERNSSNQSLSGTPKQGHKVHRPRAHGRNLSHGKNLSKLGKIHSSANIIAEVARAHNRKKSGQESSPTSPQVPLVKRNSSHVALPKNTSQPNLRKNLSATALPRNVSHGALKKIGLPPPQPKKKTKTTNEVGFELGDTSEEGEEDAEWEDSTISPEVTRNNSKTSTPARIATPNQEQRPVDYRFPHKDKTSSPPAVSLKNNNRSVPNFKSSELGQQTTQSPAILQQNGRSSRAPPAMSSMVAHAKPGHLQRNDSSRSFTHVGHEDVESSPTHIEGSSSAEGGVSHFLSTSMPLNEGSDDDSPSNFMDNYHPQPSESPEKPRTLNKSLPSRTQQRLELQRREMMRSGAMTPTTPPSPGMTFGFGSSAALHSRASSRGRTRSLAEDAKDMAKKYEVASKQLEVVQRFRSPVRDSLNRLKASGVLPSDIGVVAPVASKSRPQSRRGPSHTTNASAKGTGTSSDDQRPASTSSRPSSRGGSNRVHFQRQGSHDDIGLSRSKGSDGDQDVPDGITEEEALIRRIWESREVYDPGEGIGVR
jgi:hypothetical protein